MYVEIESECGFAYKNNRGSFTICGSLRGNKWSRNLTEMQINPTELNNL